MNNTNVLISSPNNGGLSILTNGKITYIDDINTVGLCFYKNKLFRCIQSEPLILIVYEENKTIKYIYQEIKDVHDVLCYQDTMFIVSTGTNEIFEISLSNYKIIKSHKYLGEGDAWHLNCLCIKDDSLLVSAFCNFSNHYSYKGKTKTNGFLIDLKTSNIVLDNLSQPHSPIMIDNLLYVCNSEEKSLIIKDLETNILQTIQFENYTRGITYDEKYIYVGLSSSRNIPQSSKFSTLLVLDKKDLKEINRFNINYDEIYSICILPTGWNTSILSQKISLTSTNDTTDYSIQLFIEDENGISEESSIRFPVESNSEVQKFEFDLKERNGVKSLRLDPLNDSCVVEIEKLYVLLADGQSLDLIPYITANTCSHHGKNYFFEFHDPQIYFPSLDADALLTAQKLCVELKYSHTSNDALHACTNQIAADKDHTIKLLQQEIESKTQEIESKTQEIENKTQEIENLQNEVVSIYLSKSYKVTRPLRSLMRIIRRFVR